jgi:hypothetical protein
MTARFAWATSALMEVVENGVKRKWNHFPRDTIFPAVLKLAKELDQLRPS